MQIVNLTNAEIVIMHVVHASGLIITIVFPAVIIQALFIISKEVNQLVEQFVMTDIGKILA